MIISIFDPLPHLSPLRVAYTKIPLKFSRADLSFVPADTFDLAFTYVDPMVDALGRYDDDVEFDDRVEEMKELCKSDDEEDQDIVAFDQQAQENWHSDWVMELIRITKPGKAIIIGE